MSCALIEFICSIFDMARKRYQGYGKGNRKKKVKYSTKQRGKKRKLRLRRKLRKGKRGMRLPFALRAKDCQKYTTIYKTAIRVTSKPGTCNYVSLSADENERSFRTSGTGPDAKGFFSGDMTFYGNHEKNECLRGVDNTFRDRNQGELLPNTIAYLTGDLDSVKAGGQNNQSLAYGTDLGENIYFGKHKYNLEIKSAITGANCFVTLYKCKARYDLPRTAYSEAIRPQTAFDHAIGNWTAVSSSIDGGVLQTLGFADFNSMLNLFWFESFYRDNPGNDYGNVTADGTFKHQEGTTLYQNKEWCKLFKVAKTYKFELLPGQKAVLNMKDKYIKKMNLIKMALNKSYLCTKGQVVFILQLQGTMGHQGGWGAGGTGASDQTQKFYNGTQARPNIGLMPAAVDVMCMKQLNCWMVPKKAPKIRNVIRVNDYFDDAATEAITTGYFKDSAPSDYADSAASIG